MYGFDESTSNPLPRRADSGLDVESARLIRDMIRDLNSAGVTVFLSTHNMEEANQMCEKVAIINHGKIAAIDSPERLRIRSSGLRSVEVSFDRPVDMGYLHLPGVREVRKTGDKVRFYVDDPSDVIAYLTDYVRSNKLKIISLNTLAPTLEDVFIKLIKEG